MATVTKVKRSVVPIYLVGAVWLLYGAARSMRSVGAFVVCAVLSVVAYIIGKAVFPDQTYTVQEEEKPKEPEKPKSTGNPDIDNLIAQRDKALGEMERLNDSIKDEKISAQIDHLEQVAGKIIDGVVAEPKKLPQIRKFMNYYLPTTLKILNAYDRMDAIGIEGENISATKERVAGMLDTIAAAFDKQLDSLYGEEALDISTDITVMEQMLQSEGIGAMTIGGAATNQTGSYPAGCSPEREETQRNPKQTEECNHV